MLYESKPTCLSAVEELIGRLQPVLERCSTEAAEGGDDVGVVGVSGGDSYIDGGGGGGESGGGDRRPTRPSRRRLRRRRWSCV